MVFATIYIHRETDHNEWEENGLISRMTDIFTTRLLRDAWIRGDWSRIPKDPLTLPLKQCCGRFHFDRRPEECRERRNLVRTVIPEKFFYFRLLWGKNGPQVTRLPWGGLRHLSEGGRSKVDIGAQELHQNRALSLAKAPYNIAVKRHNGFWFLI